MVMNDQDFSKACREQIERLGCFEKYQYINVEGKKELRRFFEERTRDIAKVEAAIDQAVEMENFPSRHDLGQIWMRLYPAADGYHPTIDERRYNQTYMEAWREQEERESAERKQAWDARREEIQAARNHRVTTEEIIAIASGQKHSQELLKKLRGE